MTRAPIAAAAQAEHDDVPAPPLSDFLTRAYCAQNKLRMRGADTVETLADITAEFQKCAADHKALLTEAKTERDRLRGIPANRCHISRMHLAFLNSALV
jgi:hypothetical protein